MDGDVLHHLRAQQAKEVHLDSADVKIQLGDSDGAETCLPTVGEVADDLYGVRGTAEIWVDPVGTIIHLLFTVHEVSTDACRVFLGAQGSLDALNEVAEVV